MTNFSDGASGKESACQSRGCKRLGLIPELGRFPGEKMTTHSSIPVWEIPGTEDPDRVHGVTKSRIRRRMHTLD